MKHIGEEREPYGGRVGEECLETEQTKGLGFWEVRTHAMPELFLELASLLVSQCVVQF